jgi:hypothetical protein
LYLRNAIAVAVSRRYHLGTVLGIHDEESLTLGFPHFDNGRWRSLPMANENPKRPWEERLHETGSRIEEDVREVIRYFNDEIVPDLRRNGSEALRAAARELNRMAQKMDERAGRTPPSPKDTPKP